MFFSFPEDAHWSADQQAVEFGVEIGEYRGVVTIPDACFSGYSPSSDPPPRNASKPTTSS